MATAWFMLISVMLAVYVVLDGFDFGAGILHLFVAKSDEERRTVFAAIGPVWDGNEVWLLASGGVLVYAFPRAYSAFSPAACCSRRFTRSTNLGNRRMWARLTFCSASQVAK